MTNDPPDRSEDAPPAAPRIDEWIVALLDRHARRFTRPEFLKAIRALSARYVERRHVLPFRSATDSAGKRAAFAAFYTPLHLLTTMAAVRALGIDSLRLSAIVDLGCGTGAAGAGWALASLARPTLSGVDRQSWALGEAAWNWRFLSCRGRTREGDLVLAAETLAADVARRGLRAHAHFGVVLGWAVNELTKEDRDRLQEPLLTLGRGGVTLLVVEPIGHGATPWWQDWARPFLDIGARSDQWKFDVPLPDALRDLDEAAGFDRDHLAARTLMLSSVP